MRLEDIGDGLVVAQNEDFRFGTDAILLAAFGEPRKAGERVCDLGTGCGIIPFLLQNRAHPPAFTLGVDIQEQAIRLCRLALEKNKQKTISFLQADWSTPAAIAPAGSFDRVLCNPPYFPAGGGKQNDSPARSLARHAKETTLLEVCAAAKHLLRFGGRLCLCHRPENLAAVLEALRQNGLEPKRLQAVQQKADTPPFLMLVEAVKGGKAGLIFSAPWLLEDAQTHSMIYGMYKNT